MSTDLKASENKSLPDSIDTNLESVVDFVLNQEAESLLGEIRKFPGDDNQYEVKSVIDKFGEEENEDAQKDSEIETVQSLAEYLDGKKKKGNKFLKIQDFSKSLAGQELVKNIEKLNEYVNYLSKKDSIWFKIKSMFSKNEEFSGDTSTLLSNLSIGIDESHEMISKDTNVLIDQQEEMVKELDKIKSDISALEYVESKISIEHDLNHALYYVRQRLMDLKQNVLVNHQGILAIRVLIDNNHSLIQLAKQAKIVTLNSLSNSITVESSMSTQSLVNKSLKSLINNPFKPENIVSKRKQIVYKKDALTLSELYKIYNQYKNE